MYEHLVKKLRLKKAEAKDTFRDLEKKCHISNSHLSQIFNGKIAPPVNSDGFKKLLDHYGIPHLIDITKEELELQNGFFTADLKKDLEEQVFYKSQLNTPEEARNAIPALVHAMVEGGFHTESYEEAYPHIHSGHFTLNTFFLKNETSSYNPYNNLGKMVRNFYWDHISSFDNAIEVIIKLVKDNLKNITKDGSVYTIDYLDERITLMETDPEDKDTEIVMMAYKSNKHFKDIVNAALKLV